MKTSTSEHSLFKNMPGRKKTIQTTLTNANDENGWKTIGRAKRQVHSAGHQDPKETKKTDSKSTPPRPTEQPKVTQDPCKIPLPESPKLSTDERIEAEINLIAMINAINSSKKIPTRRYGISTSQSASC
jgi:hypothetical protein